MIVACRSHRAVVSNSQASSRIRTRKAQGNHVLRTMAVKITTEVEGGSPDHRKIGHYESNIYPLTSITPTMGIWLGNQQPVEYCCFSVLENRPSVKYNLNALTAQELVLRMAHIRRPISLGRSRRHNILPPSQKSDKNEKILTVITDCSAVTLLATWINEVIIYSLQLSDI